MVRESNVESSEIPLNKMENTDISSKIKVELEMSESNSDKLVKNNLDETHGNETGLTSTRCFVCSLQAPNMVAIEKHLCLTHFRKDLKTKCAAFIHGTACGLCNMSFASNTRLMVHLGTKQDLLSQVLTEAKFSKKSNLDMKIKKFSSNSIHGLFADKLKETSNENISINVFSKISCNLC